MFGNSRRLEQLAATPLSRHWGFGTSTPTAPLPGIGATMRMLCARIASARSLERFAICRTFTPAAGATSYCVTTGPVVRPISSPSTLKVRSASISFWPIRSSSRFPASAFRGGAGVSSSGEGSASSVQQVARVGYRQLDRGRYWGPSRISAVTSGFFVFFSRFFLSGLDATALRSPRRSHPHQRQIESRHFLGRRLGLSRCSRDSICLQLSSPPVSL